MIERTVRFAARLLALDGSPWQEACPAGPPVPDLAACADCDALALTDLRAGQRATISCLADPDAPVTAKLAALGLLPGVRLALIQRSPAFVIRVGCAELALDAALASRVRVRLEAGRAV